jgi:hypothetical protein
LLPREGKAAASETFKTGCFGPFLKLSLFFPFPSNFLSSNFFPSNFLPSNFLSSNFLPSDFEEKRCSISKVTF